jgi:3-oxoacyl-[acyl-carrier-protein] synthase II
MQISRVAVTGIGGICGVGHNVEEIWNNLINGNSGISKLENRDPNLCPVPMAGIVRNFKISDNLLEPKDHDRYDRFIHFALHSTDEAIKQAGLLQADYPKHKIGCLLGVGLGGFPFIEQCLKIFLEKGARRVSPFFIPGIIPNMTTGLISMNYGFTGINHSIASACASAGHAISAAATEIMLGRCDAVITGGAESVVSDLTIAGFASMKALSKRIDDPTRASRPFDRDRDGFVMGEGAGILILENYDKAKARGAKILAEVVGFASTADAYHITAPHPEGIGAAQCMEIAIESAKIKKEDIGYINAHGTSTPVGDLAETGAIKKVFGDHAYKLNVSSTKSMTGHLLGAAGGIESVVCIQTLIKEEIAPTINLENPSEGCDLNYTANKSVKKNVRFVLNNSFGFGGTNSSLIFKKEN